MAGRPTPAILTAIAVLCLLSGITKGASAAPSPPARISIAHELVDETGDAEKSGTTAWSTSRFESIGGERVPGIFLHPPARGRASIVFSKKTLPEITPGEGLLFLVRLGLRDGVPWEGQGGRRPNGVRFIVTIDDRDVLREEVRGPGLRSRAIDLRSVAGESVAIGLHTEAIENDSNWDWAVFAEPWIATITRGTPSKDAALPHGTAGVILVHLQVDESARVTLSADDAEEKLSLATGEAMVPLHVTGGGPPELAVESGRAEILGAIAAAHAPKIEIRSLELPSPLVTLDRATGGTALIRNGGRGTFTGGEATWFRGGGASAVAREALPRLEPGREVRLQLAKAIPEAIGDASLRLEVRAAPSEDSTSAPITAARLDYRVLPREDEARTLAPLLPTGEHDARVAWAARRSEGDRVSATFITHGILETSKSDAWQRVGSLFPLAELVTREGEKRRTWDIEWAESPSSPTPSPSSAKRSVELSADLSDEGGHAARVVLAIERERIAPRFHITARLEAKRDLDVLRFAGPALLAGDRAFGARKDFAIFPGLEFLEEDESSSSTRDLAPPLHDRRVPPPHTITTPLVAVQSDGVLLSLHWDPLREWARGEIAPAARFLAPDPSSGVEHIDLGIFAPGVGRYLAPNETEAREPFHLAAGRAITLRMVLVLDRAGRYAPQHIVRGAHRGALALQAFRHHFDVFGRSPPADLPRSFEDEKALSLGAWCGPLWNDNPPGFSHCAGWSTGLLVGHAVPMLLTLRDGVDRDLASDVERRIDRVLDRALREQGPGILVSGAGSHIVEAELPFFAGYLAESLAVYSAAGRAALGARSDGLWRWQPASARHRSLGTPGDHVLGVAAHSAWRALRAARLTGDPELRRDALDALRQLELYEVPRGAQMWECPLYQPDILAAAHAVRAYCEAFRLTGDAEYIEEARYWAWTGLPFLYTWELPERPVMRWNVIAVIGSTFHTHSWIGLPVVWCGLVYAYAIQELAELAPAEDDDLPWREIARGITRSAMMQQYVEGPSRGCYPDSWNLAENHPNPADINPENILMNALRLRGAWGGIHSHRFDTAAGPVFLDTPAVIEAIKGTPIEASTAETPRAGNETLPVSIKLRLASPPGLPLYSILAPVRRPLGVRGAGDEAADGAALAALAQGWSWDATLRALVWKSDFSKGAAAVTIEW